MSQLHMHYLCHDVTSNNYMPMYNSQPLLDFTRYLRCVHRRWRRMEGRVLTLKTGALANCGAMRHRRNVALRSLIHYIHHHSGYYGSLRHYARGSRCIEASSR